MFIQKRFKSSKWRMNYLISPFECKHTFLGGRSISETLDVLSWSSSTFLHSMFSIIVSSRHSEKQNQTKIDLQMKWTEWFCPDYLITIIQLTFPSWIPLTILSHEENLSLNSIEQWIVVWSRIVRMLHVECPPIDCIDHKSSIWVVVGAFSKVLFPVKGRSVLDVDAKHLIHQIVEWSEKFSMFLFDNENLSDERWQSRASHGILTSDASK